MILLLLIGIAVLYLFLRDAYENAVDLVGVRVFLIFLTTVIIVITVLVSKHVNDFLYVLSRFR